jgi:hypothetical protein
MRKRTIHEATYSLLKQLSEQMEPVTLLAQQTSPSSEEPHPMDTMIDLLRQLVGGIEQVQLRLENLEARLDDPAVVRAIKDAARG